MLELYTIGHSTHSIEDFINLLKMHSITALCDVRSQPYSQYNPQYNRENLQKDVKQAGIAYVFLGNELGPRSDDPDAIIVDIVAGLPTSQAMESGRLDKEGRTVVKIDRHEAIAVDARHRARRHQRVDDGFFRRQHGGFEQAIEPGRPFGQ